MSWLDIFRRHRPEPVAPPQRVEPRISAVRSYAAASNTVRLSDMSSFVGSADNELIASLARIRTRARVLAMNSPVMQRFIALMQDNIVGENGFHLRTRVKRLDGTFDKTLNDNVQNAFWKWCDGGLTVDGQIGWVDFLRLMVESWSRDGEFILEFITGSSYRDSFAVNPIEPDLLDDTLNTIYPATGNEIRMGVEVDSRGKPVAYHFLTYHPGDAGWFGNRKNARKYRRVPADRVLHLYTRRRIGQSRGEPPIASVVRDLKMLDGYREAELTSRRVAASTMGFITKNLREAGDGKGVEAFADGAVGEGAEAELVIDMEPGVFKRLPEGFSIEKFEGTATSVDFKQFDGQIKRSLSQGLGISAFSLGMETDGVSYSTARTVVIEDRDFYRGKQRMFARVAMSIFRKWVPLHMLSNASSIAPSRAMAVLEASEFRTRGWAWVDPAKDVSSNAEALRTRQTSLSRIAAAQGVDFDDLLEQIAADEESLAALGLTLTFDKTPTNNGQNDNPDALVQA